MAVYVQTNQAITLNDINDNILTSENGRIFLIPVLTGNRLTLCRLFNQDYITFLSIEH